MRRISRRRPPCATPNLHKNKKTWPYIYIYIYIYTPYSINSLFSEFFRNIGGALLEVCETISGGILQVLRGKIKDDYPEQK